MPRSQPVVEVLEQYYSSDDDDSFYSDARYVRVPDAPPPPPLAPIRTIQTVRPARPRAQTRLSGQDRRYLTSDLLIPPTSRGTHHRSHSASGITRPQQQQQQQPQPTTVIVDINNEQREQRREDRREERREDRLARQPSKARSRSRRRIIEHDYVSDSDWDEIEHERIRHHHRPRSHTHSHSRTHSRTPSPRHHELDLETKLKLQQLELMENEKKAQEALEMKKRIERLKVYEEQEEKRKREKELKEKLALEEAKKAMEEVQRKQEEEELRKRAIEDWNREQAIEKEKKKKAQEEADRLFEQRVKREFTAAGYSADHIDTILKRGKTGGSERTFLDLAKPTYSKVNRIYICPDTLDHHHIPWEWDSHDSDSIIIKRWIDKDLQEQLFAHTARLNRDRSTPTRKLITETAATTTELKVNDAKRDKLYLVRKKSPNRRSWFLT